MSGHGRGRGRQWRTAKDGDGDGDGRERGQRARAAVGGGGPEQGRDAGGLAVVWPLVIGHWRVRAGTGTTMGLEVRGRAVHGRGRHLPMGWPRVGTAVGKCGRWRGRPRAKEYSTSSSLSKNKV